MEIVKSSFCQTWAVRLGENTESTIKVSGTVGSDHVLIEMHDPDMGGPGHESSPQTVTKGMTLHALRELMLQVEKNASRELGKAVSAYDRAVKKLERAHKSKDTAPYWTMEFSNEEAGALLDRIRWLTTQHNDDARVMSELRYRCGED